MATNQSLTQNGSFRAPVFFLLLRAKGFTLVEMMVVVAIIGLLSAIAIPNFRKFQARSRTTEAKLQLAAIYMAEASFYSTYQMYHNCLMAMGYDPTEYRTSRYYAVGFNSAAAINSIAYQTAINLDLLTSTCPQNYPAANDITYFEAGIGVGTAVANSSYLPPNSVGSQADSDTMTYTAGAGGVIFKDATSNTAASAFTIDEKKIIQTVRNGY